MSKKHESESSRRQKKAYTAYLFETFSRNILKKYQSYLDYSFVIDFQLIQKNNI